MSQRTTRQPSATAPTRTAATAKARLTASAAATAHTDETARARLTAAFLWHKLSPFIEVDGKKVAACENCGKSAIVNGGKISGQAVESGCE